jgi:hypothetical protein
MDNKQFILAKMSKLKAVLSESEEERSVCCWLRFFG